jgi:NUMOD1 domain
MGKHYLYRHIRPDKNEPFYIGVGTKQKRSAYMRAYKYQDRSELWTNIYLKNNKNIEIQILFESDNYEFIKEKEIEFIALYGRIDLGTGTLANHTNGGDGGSGFNKTRILQKSMDMKIAWANGRYDSRIGFKHTDEAKLKISKAGLGRIGPKRRPVLQFTKDGEYINRFESITAAAKSLNISPKNIDNVVSGRYKTSKGYRWKYADL